MGLKSALGELRGGYPGGWKKYARGAGGDRVPSFVQPTDSDDRRSLIPALGLPEYWYPALPASTAGYPSRIVNNRAVQTVNRENAANYYAGGDGQVRMQLYYPRVGGYWPLHRYRLLWKCFFELCQKGGRQGRQPDQSIPEEWRSGMHLPGMQRLPHLYTRWCVPVEKDLTRTVYFRTRRIPTKLGRLRERLTFKPLVEWLNHYNFSGADYGAMATTRWQYPEYLSATDSFVVAERRLIAEHPRGLRPATEVAEVTTAEREVVEAHELLGVQREGDFGLVGRAP